MLESSRVQDIVDQLKQLSAADMKQIANFGKVKGYSQVYQDLKDSLRTMLVMARNVHGINLDSEFFEIEAIRFRGMIPNEVFNNERRQVIEIGERLYQEVSMRSGVAQRQNVSNMAQESDMMAVAEAVNGSMGSTGPVQAYPPQRPRIFVSEPGTSEVTLDLKRCLATADCDSFSGDGPSTAAAEYTPASVIGTMKSCDGAVICLLDPSVENGDESTLSDADKDRLINHVMMELGIALSHFPDRLFFVVQDDLADDVPEAFRHLISHRISDNKMSFDDGQRLVQIFKQNSWAV